MPTFLFVKGLGLSTASQSKAFFIIPLKLPLYYGVAIRIPCDFLTSSHKSLTALGTPKLIKFYYFKKLNHY